MKPPPPPPAPPAQPSPGGPANGAHFTALSIRCAARNDNSCRPMTSDRLSLPDVSASISKSATIMGVLVVEDDKKIASFVVNGLKQSGFAVDHSANGEDGLIMGRTVP